MDSLFVQKGEMIAKSEVVDVYKHIAQQQSTDFTSIITALIGMTAVLVGSTWIWNFIVAKKQIKNEVQEHFTQSKTDFETQISEFIKSKFLELEKSIDNKLKYNEANLARLYAVNCSNQLLHSTSISWWLTALKSYTEINDEYFIRLSVEQILNNVKTDNWFNDLIDNLNLTQAIQDIEMYVPNMLSKEKKQIIFHLSSQLPQ